MSDSSILPSIGGHSVVALEQKKDKERDAIFFLLHIFAPFLSVMHREVEREREALFKAISSLAEEQKMSVVPPPPR